MTNPRDNPKPMIYQEHDGSWTWSIELGEPFEDGYEVIDRNDGYLTRNDAKEAMVEALAHHQENLEKKASHLGQPPSGVVSHAKAAREPAKPTDIKKQVSTDRSRSTDELPEWAVIVDGQIVALFINRAQAKKFGQMSYRGKHSIQRLVYRITLATRDEDL